MNLSNLMTDYKGDPYVVYNGKLEPGPYNNPSILVPGMNPLRETSSKPLAPVYNEKTSKNLFTDVIDSVDVFNRKIIMNKEYENMTVDGVDIFNKQILTSNNNNISVPSNIIGSNLKNELQETVYDIQI